MARSDIQLGELRQLAVERPDLSGKLVFGESPTQVG